MSLWRNFIASFDHKDKPEFTSRLHQKVFNLLPNEEEKTLIFISCLSGLLARVALNDLVVHVSEIQSIERALQQWTSLSPDQIKAVTALCLEEAKDLCGIENHLYCLPLRESLVEKERFNLIKTLFAVAAADGTVENQESEEIRTINTALLLEPKHFNAAKATVLDFLGSLKTT